MNIRFVRLKIGDTDSSNYALADEDIRLLAADVGGNDYATAIACAEALAARYTAESNGSVGDVTAWGGDLADKYRKLAVTLRRQFTLRNATPYSGGLLKSEHEIRQEDDTLVQPSFTRDLQEVSGSATSADTSEDFI